MRKTKIDAADPAMSPGVIDLSRRGLGISCQSGAHCLDERRDLRVVSPNATFKRTQCGGIGIRKRGLDSDLHHFRSEAIRIDIGDEHPRAIRFAHAKSSQVRSAAQSIGFTSRGALAFASRASRSAICAHREPIGTSIRRIKVDRKAPLESPQGLSPRPVPTGSSLPTTQGSRRAQPGYSIGG